MLNNESYESLTEKFTAAFDAKKRQFRAQGCVTFFGEYRLMAPAVMQELAETRADSAAPRGLSDPDYESLSAKFTRAFDAKKRQFRNPPGDAYWDFYNDYQGKVLGVMQELTTNGSKKRPLRIR